MGRFPGAGDYYLDHYMTPLKRGQRAKRPRMTAREPRQRWRITLDQLCYAAGIQPAAFDVWARNGYLGKRLAAYPDKGRGRHITRVTAQRTVLLARLVKAGMREEAAAHVVAGHCVGDVEPLEVEMPGGVRVSIPRIDLP